MSNESNITGIGNVGLQGVTDSTIIINQGKPTDNIQGFSPSAPQPFISSLPNAKYIEGREEECEIILRAMNEDKARVMAFAVPGGFGKTSLLAKLAEKISVDGKSLVEKVKLQNGGTIEPHIGAWLYVDCRNDVKVSELFPNAGKLIGQEQAFRDIYNTGKLPAALQEIFNRLSQGATKRVWFVFDNFEPLLDKDGKVKDAELREFFKGIYLGGHKVRVLVASRKIPSVLERFESQFLKLEEVIKGLFAGLPEEDCVRYLRGRKVQRGLSGDDAKIDAKLKEFAKKVHSIPMALVSVAGYLNKKKTKTLNDILENEKLFADFESARLYNDDVEYLEKGLKTLHREQLEAQPENALPVLRLLAFFNRHVPLGALAHLLSENELEDVLSQLEDADYLITHRESEDGYARYLNDRLAIDLYGLHPVICDNDFFNRQPDKERLYETAADECWKRAFDAYRINRFAYSVELFDCAEKLYEHLTEKLNRDDLENSYAATLMNKGVSLDSLGKLNEAIESYERAIEILERLVNRENRTELSNDLAAAYMNKGVSLSSLGKLNEAIESYERAIRPLAKVIKRCRVQNYTTQLSG
jgi:tetratricopeptide (TPR) repeat protein